MRKHILFCFAVGWVILLIGACQDDPINPGPAVDPDIGVTELMSQPFALNLDVTGVDNYVDPLAKEGDDDQGGTDLPCIGKVEVYGMGFSSYNLKFQTMLDFTFDPQTCACGGVLKVETLNAPRYVFAFELMGIGHLPQSLMTSEEIAIPAKLIYSSAPRNESWEGHMFLRNPKMLSIGQNEVVETSAYLKTAPVSSDDDDIF